jgi:hypothetical protein
MPSFCAISSTVIPSIYLSILSKNITDQVKNGKKTDNRTFLLYNRIVKNRKIRKFSIIFGLDLDKPPRWGYIVL